MSTYKAEELRMFIDGQEITNPLAKGTELEIIEERKETETPAAFRVPDNLKFSAENYEVPPHWPIKVEGCPEVTFIPFSIRITQVRIKRLASGQEFDQVAVEFEVISVETGQPIELNMVERFFPRPFKPEEVARSVYGMMLKVMRHEVDESLFVNREHYKDPHPEKYTDFL